MTVTYLVTSREKDLPHGKEATMIDAMAAAQRRRDAGEADTHK
jgi:hypothetical protein